MQAIRSALSLGLRPSAHILGLRDPRSKWTAEDHSAAIAYQIVSDETCPECGKPVWICRSGNQNIDFKVMVDVCYVSKAKETSKKKLKPGEFLYVRPEMRGERPMPSREDYYRERAEEAALHSKSRKP